jgi:hypothetical protein
MSDMGPDMTMARAELRRKQQAKNNQTDISLKRGTGWFGRRSTAGNSQKIAIVIRMRTAGIILVAEIRQKAEQIGPDAPLNLRWFRYEDFEDSARHSECVELSETNFKGTRGALSAPGSARGRSMAIPTMRVIAREPAVRASGRFASSATDLDGVLA